MFSWRTPLVNRPIRKAWRRDICGVTSTNQENVLERRFLDGALGGRSVGRHLTVNESGTLPYRGEAQIVDYEFRQDDRRAGKEGVRHSVEHLNRLANIDRKFWLARPRDDHEAGARGSAGQQ